MTATVFVRGGGGGGGTSDDGVSASSDSSLSLAEHSGPECEGRNAWNWGPQTPPSSSPSTSPIPPPPPAERKLPESR